MDSQASHSASLTLSFPVLGSGLTFLARGSGSALEVGDVIHKVLHPRSGGCKLKYYWLLKKITLVLSLAYLPYQNGCFQLLFNFEVLRCFFGECQCHALPSLRRRAAARASLGAKPFPPLVKADAPVARQLPESPLPPPSLPLPFLLPGLPSPAPEAALRHGVPRQMKGPRARSLAPF